MQVVHCVLYVGLCHYVREFLTVAAEPMMLLVGPTNQLHVMRAWRDMGSLTRAHLLQHSRELWRLLCITPLLRLLLC
jgi:hypothetical protein